MKDRRDWILGDCVGTWWEYRSGSTCHAATLVPLEAPILSHASCGAALRYRLDTVFLFATGEWKLGGFELFNHPTESNIVFVVCNSFFPRKCGRQAGCFQSVTSFPCVYYNLRLGWSIYSAVGRLRQIDAYALATPPVVLDFLHNAPQPSARCSWENPHSLCII